MRPSSLKHSRTGPSSMVPPVTSSLMRRIPSATTRCSQASCPRNSAEKQPIALRSKSPSPAMTSQPSTEQSVHASNRMTASRAQRRGSSAKQEPTLRITAAGREQPRRGSHHAGLARAGIEGIAPQPFPCPTAAVESRKPSIGRTVGAVWSALRRISHGRGFPAPSAGDKLLLTRKKTCAHSAHLEEDACTKLSNVMIAINHIRRTSAFPGNGDKERWCNATDIGINIL